jgi:hypothetical protein
MQLDHKSEMIQRRERQRTRRAPTVQERIKSWEKINTERAIARLAPIRFKLDRSKYTGAVHRRIRARAINYKGEPQQ